MAANALIYYVCWANTQYAMDESKQLSGGKTQQVSSTLARSHGLSEPLSYLIYKIPWTHTNPPAHGIMIGSAVCAQLSSVPNRQTDRHTETHRQTDQTMLHATCVAVDRIYILRAGDAIQRILKFSTDKRPRKTYNEK